MTIPNRAGSSMSYFGRNIRNKKAINPYSKFYSDIAITAFGISSNYLIKKFRSVFS